MIKIETFYSNKIKTKYIKHFLPKIKSKYEKNKPQIDEVKKLFENDANEFDEKKVKRYLRNKKMVVNPVRYTDEANEEIAKIMDYSLIYDTPMYVKKSFGEMGIRHALLVDLGIQTCPYCNRQFITSNKMDGVDVSTADIDHFRSQKEYPLLSLNLWNFVPSCQICNSRMKHDKANEILYPFDEGFDDDCIFKLVPVNKQSQSDADELKDDLDIIKGRSSKRYKLELCVTTIDTEKRNKIDANKIVFLLEDVYQIHTGYAQQMRFRKAVYGNPEYIDSFGRKIKREFNLSDEDTEAFIYGFHWNDDNKHDVPLSKLVYDIIKK